MFKYLDVEVLIQAKILDRYLELLDDEEADVLSASIKSLSQVINKLGK
jgi:hypothetical protein